MHFVGYKKEKVMKPRSPKLSAMLQAIETVHELDFRFTLKHDPKSVRPQFSQRVLGFPLSINTRYQA